MSERLCRVFDCDLPIQLAPMGSVSASARLPLAVSAAGAHAMYPGLSLPPAALAPVLEALVGAKAAFGVNFIVPFMNVDSLELAVDQAPYVDFFLADPTVAWWSVSTPAARAAGGRSSRSTRLAPLRRLGAMS